MSNSVSPQVSLNCLLSASAFFFRHLARLLLLRLLATTWIQCRSWKFDMLSRIYRHLVAKQPQCADNEIGMHSGTCVLIQPTWPWICHICSKLPSGCVKWLDNYVHHRHKVILFVLLSGVHLEDTFHTCADVFHTYLLLIAWWLHSHHKLEICYALCLDKAYVQTLKHKYKPDEIYITQSPADPLQLAGRMYNIFFSSTWTLCYLITFELVWRGGMVTATSYSFSIWQASTQILY